MPRATEWLVPGMLADKVTALVRSLPQKLRRHLVPLPDFVDGFVARAAPDGPLVDALIADLRDERGVVAQPSDFKVEAVPAHLAMNFRIVDEHGRQLAMGRNLAALRAELGHAARHQFKEAFARVAGAVSTSDAPANDAPARHAATASTPAAARAAEPPTAERYTDWTFGALPELLEVRRGGQTLIGYPALVDQRDHVTVEVFDEPAEAAAAHRAGLARLFRIQLHEQLRYLEKNLPDATRMAMQFMPFGTADELREQIVGAALERAALTDPLPIDAAGFEARRHDAKSRVVLLANETARTVGTILDQVQAVQKKLPAAKKHPAALADIEAQLAALVHRRFVETTPPEQLKHLPRYLKAIALRIDKLAADAARDAQRMAEMSPLSRGWQRAVASRKGAPDDALDAFRWLLEELRVALFAQELRTPAPVSVKRLQKVWEQMQR